VLLGLTIGLFVCLCLFFYCVYFRERPATMQDSFSQLSNVREFTAQATGVESPQKWTKGRPKFASLLGRLVADVDSTCVLACGPGRMVADVESVSKKKGFDFHKEIFAF
jgi:hypothetical protein